MSSWYINVVLVLLVYFLGKKAFFKLRQRWFAGFCTRMAGFVEKATRKVKDELFSHLNEIVSSDPELKMKKQIRILEIGCGSGPNLKYFPENSRLVLVDLNPEFENHLRDNLTQFPSLHVERLVHGDAADLSMLPSGSVDVAVSTTVLCSVSDPYKVLAEIRRVLAPGGKFLFLEHVLAESDTKLNKVQRILTALGIWPLLFCGCHLSRDIGKMISESGFTSVKKEPFNLNANDHIVFNFIRSQISGVAMK